MKHLGDFRARTGPASPRSQTGNTRDSGTKDSRTPLKRIGLGAIAIAIMITAPAWAAGPVEVKLEAKFPEGRAIRYRVRTSKNQLVKNLGMEMPSNQDRTVVYAIEAGPRRGDSTRPVSVKLESLRERQRLPGGRDVLHDSKDPSADRVAHPDLEFFKPMYRVEDGLAFTAILDARGRVKAIEGGEVVRSKLSTLDPVAVDLLKSRLSDDSLAREFERAIGLSALPDAPVKPGASWEKTEAVDVGAGIELVLKKKYEYTGTEKKGNREIDRIKIQVLEVHCRQDADSSSPMKLAKEEIKVISSEGFVLFDRSEGRALEVRDRVQLEGRLTLAHEGRDQQVGFDLTIRTESQPAGGS